MSSGSVPFPANGLPVLSFVLTWLVLLILIRTWSHRVLDHPNERSLHHQPVPRTGGIGIALGMAGTVPFISPTEWWPMWIGVLLLVGTSFLDDLMGLPVLGRLGIHFIAASTFMSALLPNRIESGWIFMAIVAVVAIVWMINLYNFMDGMDGLAGGMAVFGFGFLAIAAWLGGNVPFALVNAIIASAAGAFLLFNFYPARIFLGDAGSTAFGFLAAGMALIGWRDGVWSLWFPVLVFSPFIVDATVTLLKRVVLGEKFWQAHRSHCYQRLVLSGWGQRRTILAEYSLMAFCGFAALACQRLSQQHRILLLSICVALFVILAIAVHRIQRQSSKKWV
jgi:UDP-GlcNAc:undecaprenyl-phosphate/decaprenyl-phosphate GlcNAc-1-phosphate transferase